MHRNPNREKVADMIRAYGMAKLANELDVSRVAVWHWVNPSKGCGNGVPAQRCGAVAKKLNCKLYDLRPDLFDTGS